MQTIHARTAFRRKALRIAAVAAPAAAVAFFAGDVFLDVLTLVSGGAVIAFLIEPLAVIYEKKLSRSLSALCAIFTILAALLLAAWALLPAIISELAGLASALPESVSLVRSRLTELSLWIQAHLPGIELPTPRLEAAPLPQIAVGTISFAGNIAGVFYKLSLMVVLSYFLLCDRARLMIRLELLVPRSVRRTAVRMGNAVCRELRLYLRGQGMIAIAVGALAVLGLCIVGVPSALVLGIFVGVLNMIPYFGPVLGGIPAVLTALGSGWQTAALTVVVLWLVQQIDGTLISPRIMSGLTGLSPAAVLLAIFAGSAVGGIVGMLLALPLLMTFRTVFRVFVQRHENV